MADIKNLTSKIIKNANDTAKDTIDKAREKENDMILKKVAIAEKEKDNILAKAELEIMKRRQQIISNANLKVRDMKLSTKREVLDKVFNQCIKKLNEMNETHIKKFIKNSILSLNIDGDEKIILNKNNFKDIDRFIKEINESLKGQGKVGELTLATEERDIGAGYILCKNGVEINSTFKFLIESLKNDMEYEVAKALFS